MQINVLRPCAAGLLALLVPAYARADQATMPVFGSPPAAAGHVWVTGASTKQELPVAQTQVAQMQMNGAGGNAMGSSMLKSVASSALAFAAGPIGAVASSVFSMFGHHASPPKPNIHMVLALAGEHSANELAAGSPEFELNYADIPGLDPDAYTPEVLKLSATKDNWRVVSASDSSDPSAMSMMMMPAGMPVVSATAAPEAPKLTEDRVPAASIVMLSRGRARISFAQPLDPGEYGIVLRPIDSKQTAGLQIALRTVWDFSVPGQAPQH